MDTLYSVMDFEDGDGVQEINSPRSEEACLRLGYSPAELLPRPREAFVGKDKDDVMVDIQYEFFEKKRKEKVLKVKHEREAITRAMEALDGCPKELAQLSQLKHPTSERTPSVGSMSPGAPATTNRATRAERGEVLESAMLELEKQRLEVVKRRQECEIRMVMEREAALADIQLQQKLAEAQQLRRKKEHEKAAAEQRSQASKKATTRLKEKAKHDAEELQQRKLLAKREAERVVKFREAEQQKAHESELEAMEREAERKQYNTLREKRTEEMILKQIQQLGESREQMEERAARVQAQLEQRKSEKAEEARRQRDAAAERIRAALEGNVRLQLAKKKRFEKKQAEALARAKEQEDETLAKLKQQAGARLKEERARVQRLKDTAQLRMEQLHEIEEKRLAKDRLFERIQAEQQEQMRLRSFVAMLKRDDKRENVERIKRVDEFVRFQTLQRIECEDVRREQIKEEREALLLKRREQMRKSVVRKHQIQEVTELMRIRNDFTLMDKLITEGRGRDKGMRRLDSGDQLVETV